MFFSREVAMKIPSGADTRLFRCDPTASGGYSGNNFDTVLSDITQRVREDTPVLGKGALEAMIRIIENQVRSHYIHSLRTSFGTWRCPRTWEAGFRYVYDLSPSINRHPTEPKQDAVVPPDTLNRIIDRSSQKYGVGADLIRAVIRAESDFDPQATSSKGAMGLMQLMPETAGDLGVDDPYDPAQNVMAGTQYLKSLLDRYDGDTNVALAAYNWGMGNVERNPGRLPEETKTYITRVTRYRDQATV
jgi:hypothetical protein